MAIEITEARETDVAGVSTRSIEGTKFNWDYINGDQIIDVHGTSWLAAGIAAAILHTDTRWFRYGNVYKTIKWGPGGRRLYVAVTEKLVEEIIAEYPEHDPTHIGNGRYYRNARELNRGLEINEFALQLIDLL